MLSNLSFLSAGFSPNIHSSFLNTSLFPGVGVSSFDNIALSVIANVLSPDINILFLDINTLSSSANALFSAISTLLSDTDTPSLSVFLSIYAPLPASSLLFLILFILSCIPWSVFVWHMLFINADYLLFSIAPIAALLM